MKYVVLSGVSGGMGLATAKKLTSNGYYVFGLDIKEPSEQIDNLEFIKTNLREQASIEAAFNKISEKQLNLDFIISMAGIYEMNSLIEMSEEDFIKIFDINVFSIYRLNKTFAPLLKEKGKVIMVSSELAPLDPLPFTGIYAITKSTVETSLPHAPSSSRQNSTNVDFPDCGKPLITNIFIFTLHFCSTSGAI